MLCGFNLSLICKAIEIYSAIMEPRKKKPLNYRAQPLKLTYFIRSKLQGEWLQRFFPCHSHYLFSVGSFFPLPRSARNRETISLSHRHTAPKRKQTVQYRVYKMKEEKNILGKYQTTYFMIFKCHFCSNIDFLTEDEL